MMKKIKELIQFLFSLFGFRILKINSIPYYSIPIEASENEKKIIKVAKQFSMTSEARMFSLTQAFKYVVQNQIQGDLVECGVWRGGNLILFAKLLEEYKINKDIFGYDTFEGMSTPSRIDVNLKGKLAIDLLQKEKKNENLENTMWAYSSIDSVKKNFNKSIKVNQKLNLIKGNIIDTLKVKENLPLKISILRLDTDFYESTQIELEILFPLLSKGGVLIVDDYGQWFGARKAVDEYFYKKRPWLHVVDQSCRIIIKD